LEIKVKYLKRHKLINIARQIREWIQFSQRDFSAPSPNFIKMKTLVSFATPRGNWVETGTYLGGTCKYLAKRFSSVISIEPSEYFHQYSKTRLKKFKNVQLLNGTSEDLFEDALVATAPQGNLWLDGHFSDGGTFLGPKISPISEELISISKHKDKFTELVIFIDDVRLFPRNSGEETGYPQFQFLIDWCRDNEFEWQIQNDIFIAKMRS
jgi:hypothetical protein